MKIEAAVAAGSQDTVHNQYISAVHVHSEAIDTAGYAYVLLPNQSREAVDAFAQKPSVHVLVNDANHQVVFDAEQNIWGVVKYPDTPYQVNEFIRLKHAGMYLIRQTDTGYMIAMHHPTVSNIEPLQAIDTIGVVTNTQKTTAENATHYWTINLSERKPMPQDGWSWETDHWVYYKQGIAQTGWFQDSNAWYFADAEGVMQTGWQQINGQWYYLHSGGQMAIGWQQINGQWHYLATNGAMVVGVQFIDHRMYRFSAQGVWIP